MLSQINRKVEKNECFQFNIASIDNIPVYVIMSDKHLYIKITTIIDTYIDDYLLIYELRILEPNVSKCNNTHLEKIKSTLNNLKFNKLIGKFQLATEENRDITIDELKSQDEFYSNFNSNVTIIKKYDECPICFDSTMSKSECGHFCCYVCWSQIKIHYCDNYEDGEIGHVCDDENCHCQKCPICRQTMIVSKV